MAILVTAREIDSQFEWTAHEPVALKEGLSQEIIDIVKYRKSVAGVTGNRSGHHPVWPPDAPPKKSEFGNIRARLEDLRPKGISRFGLVDD